MSKRDLFAELVTGIKEVREHDKGQVTLRTYEVEELEPLPVMTAELVRSTREAMNVSQAVFARRLRVSKRTLENWEQGRTKPNDQATALILMVRRYPDTMDRLAELR